jgi:hypothetical protein
MNGNFKAPGFSCNQAVSTQSMLTCISAGDMGGVSEGEEVHVDALACRCKKGEPERQVGLDGWGEMCLAALGGLVFGSADATKEMASLGDQETTVVEPANQGVKVFIGDFGGGA